MSASRGQRNLRLRALSLVLIHFPAKYTRPYVCRDVQLLSAYLARFSRRSFRLLFPLFIRYNVRRFVPVTLAEWCQLHKDSCRAQKCRRGCWRGKLSVLEGIYREKERGLSASEQKGPYVLEREAREIGNEGKEWEKERPERISSTRGEIQWTRRPHENRPIANWYRHGTF